MPTDMIGKTIENYRIERMLGQGGMAAVYEAADQKLDRRVALKVMHDHLAAQRSFREMFVREAQNASRLDHPNIVRVYGFNITGEYLYMVMELIPGGNLRRYVKQLAGEGEFIDYPEASEIIRQLAAAIHYAHDHGMTHRDLKPDNVMLKPLPPKTPGIDYRPIITDFGLAQLTNVGTNAATMQQPIGTYPYMSPEQVNAEAVDRRTDIYALGIMLYELSVGRLPYNPKSIAEAAKMHGREPLPLPSEFVREFPQPLEEIIVRCLEKDKNDRYSDAAQLAQDLSAFINMGEPPRSQLSAFIEQAVSRKPARPPVSKPELKPDAPTPPPPVDDRPQDVLVDGPPTEPEAPADDHDTPPPADDHDTPPPADDEPEGFSTEVQTVAMSAPLPTDIPDDIQQPERTAEQRTLDCLAVYSQESSFIQILPADQTVFNIGREPVDDIYLPGETVSRQHARLERKPNGVYYLVDTNALNPTRVGSRELEPEREVILRERVIVRIGSYWLTLLPKETIEQQPAEDDPDYTTDAGYAPVSDGQPTKLMGIVPRDAVPTVEPPKLTPEQITNDRLVVYHRDQDPRIVLLTEDQYIIGRATDNDLVLDSEYISRRHARVTRSGDYLYIHDLSTLNGTWFDQERLEPGTPHRLNASRVIRIGDYYLLFEAGRNLGTIVGSTGGVGSVVARGLSSAGAERDDTYDDTIETVAMVRPLEPEIPEYSAPVLSNEMRASDHLIFISEDHPVQVAKLDKEVLSIGRASTQDIRLQGRRISREHIVLELRNDGNIYVTDTESRNGVWLDDILLVPGTQALWQKHEVMRLANYWVKFQRGVGALDPFAAGTSDQRGLVGKTIGVYRIDRYIGESNLSAVYKATDIQLERDVAMRLMHPDRAADPNLRQQFLDEARALSRLDHPNVVTVMSYNNLEGEFFMVMELITGGTLRGVLINLGDRGTRLELTEGIDISVQLANGLHYAHQQGLIHRDIKPDSITLKSKNVVGPIKKYTPILTDFAVAENMVTESIFESENDIADYAYFSPEQCRGDRIDLRSDIYELGTTVYELITGRPPFQPRSVQEAVRMHTREKPVPPSELRPDVPPEIEAVIMRALAKDPADRYQSAIDFARALQRATALAEQEGSVVATDDTLTGTFATDTDQSLETSVMDAELPREIPLMTEPPRPEGEVRYDRLVFFSENAPTTVVDMDQPVMTVGREDDQSVQLPSESVSRRHARIERSNDGTYRLKDVHSTNGTYLGNYKLIPETIEIWEPNETVRLGDYWLRIETREQLEADKHAIARQSAAPAPGEHDDEYETDAGVPAPNRPKPAHDRIGVEVSTNTVTVAPGSSATLSVEIANQNDFVETFMIDVVGLPEEWVTQTADEIDLMPYNRQTTSITFHPPLASTSSEGSHAFEVRVRAQAKQIDAVYVQCALVVQPFYAFTSELYPERVRNQGRLELTIRNTGNVHSTYNIAAKDREQALKFSIEGGVQYTVAPGRIENVNVRVAPRNRPLLGQSQFYTFDVTVTPNNEVAGGPQTLPGEVAVTSRFSWWMIILPIILLLLCAAITGGTVFFNQRNAAMQQTQVALANQTQAVETATAAVQADDDGDRLSNAREIELGTDPNDPDTDGDGLSDGEEVLSWSTDPLNRDTDGDTLTDGQEVNETGTNPLVPDTDDDGVNDANDPFPALQSTPTPTAFPTVPGTDGDVCPGSPTPSQLEIGIQGIVAPGGVPNRLRDAPNLDGEIVGYMPQEESFTVLDGPVCDDTDFIRWWYIDYDGLQAWTAEGEGEEYYLIPPDAEGNGESDDPDSNTDTDTAATDSGREDFITVVDTQSALPAPGTVSLDRARMGLQAYTNITTNEWDATLNAADPLGVRWLKVQANWRYLQPDAPNQSTAQLEAFYSHVRAAKGRGYNVLVSVAKAPDWARSTTSQAGPPDDPDDLARFIDQLLAAVGDDIDAIEIWNEPNLAREWTSDDQPRTGAAYMDLFVPTYRRIREFSPDILVISAGLAPTADSSQSADDRAFLRQMYENGLADFRNVAVGVHPYGWGNPPDAVCCPDPARGWDEQPQFYFLHTLVDYRNIMLRYGDDDAQLWVTEFGWTTWGDLGAPPPEQWMTFVSPDQQGQYISRAFEIGQSLDYIGPMVLWNLNFANVDTITTTNEIAGYSLTVTNDNRDIRTRPAFQYLMGRLQ